MSLDPMDQEDEQYASSEDSDFAPENAQDAGSDLSDSEEDATAAGTKKRDVISQDKAGEADYDNSGDEAIIERGKRKKRRKDKDGAGDAEDDEGGEGGLIKTRRQRAAEKEERKQTAAFGPVTVDVDAIWEQMVNGTAPSSNAPDSTAVDESIPKENDEPQANGAFSTETPEGMVRIKRRYNFAGQVHTEEKLVPRDSAEAKLFLESNGEVVPEEGMPAKRVTKKAFRSAFEPLTDPLPQRGDLNLGMAARIQAGKEAQAKKLNTVEKSRMDWAGFVDKEGIKDELELASKSKGSYAARQDFLARSEARREDDARQARLGGRV